ncbi:MAG: hypothetical protein U1E46_04965 [Hyphomicrobiales bacterium]
MTHPDVMPSLSRPALWAAIRDADLPGATRKTWSTDASLQEWLYVAHNLTEESARRLEQEYRRFLYLKAVDGGLLAPSRLVDQAWHFHLGSEDNGWSRFCRDVLSGQHLEHRTGLSPEEAQSLYVRTLDLYRQEFGEEPPRDIWPTDVDKRAAGRAYGLANVGIIVFLSGSLLGASGIALWTGGALFLAGICILVAASRISVGIDLPRNQNSNCG